MNDQKEVPFRIFISYGRDEYSELAFRLEKDLQSRGHEVWIDKTRLMAGRDWEYDILRGLNWAAEIPGIGRFLLLMTPHSVRQPDGFCLNELRAARNRGLIIIPIMTVKCEQPLSISGLQYIDFQDCLNPEKREIYSEKFEELYRAIIHGIKDSGEPISDVYRALRPLDFGEEIASHLSQFVGREWLFRRIDDWLSRPSAQRIIWLIGPPGVGKTAFAARLCDTRPEVVAAIHFCRFGHEDKASPRRCIMSLAFQLSARWPEYRRRLSHMDLWDERQKSAETLFDNLIVQPLASMPPPPNNQLIVIDALDEAMADGKNELAEFIVREFIRTPDWLRLFITSRPEGRILSALQSLSPLILDAASAENIEDIRSYLEGALASMALPQTKSFFVTDALMAKSEGLFLYAVQVVKELRNGTLSVDRIDEFPRGLGGIYARFFSRQFPDVQEFRDCVRPLLEIIMAAKAPLPVDVLRLSGISNEYELRETFVRIGSLFPVQGDCIRPFHQSVLDWLSNPQTAGDYFIDKSEGRLRLAEICWSEHRTDPRHMNPYVMEYLPVHLAEAERWRDLLEFFKKSGSAAIAGWIDQGEVEKGLFCLLGLIRSYSGNRKELIISAGLATQAARLSSLAGRHEEALGLLNFALERTSFLRGRRIRSIALHEIASIELYQGNLDKAGRLYRKALCLNLGFFSTDRDEMSANLIGLSTVCRNRYDLDKTLRFARKAIRMARAARDISHEIAGERLLGTVYKLRGEYEAAEGIFNKALWLCEKNRLRSDKVRVRILQAWLHYEKSFLKGESQDSAIRIFREALLEGIQIRDYYTILEAKIGLGEAWLKEKNPDEAANWIEPLRGVLPENQYPDLQSSLKRGLAALHHQRAEWERAEISYREAAAYCLKYGIPGWRIKVGLGALYWHRKNMTEAKKSWAEALQMAKCISPHVLKIMEIEIERCKTDPRLTP